MPRYATEDDLIDAAKALITYETTQRILAAKWGISPSYLSDFLAGKRGPGPAILKGLGYAPQPFYRKYE